MRHNVHRLVVRTAKHAGAISILVSPFADLVPCEFVSARKRFMNRAPQRNTILSRGSGRTIRFGQVYYPAVWPEQTHVRRWDRVILDLADAREQSTTDDDDDEDDGPAICLSFIKQAPCRPPNRVHERLSKMGPFRYHQERQREEMREMDLL